MKLYSTNNPSLRVSLREAVLRGLPEDNGLYMPEQLPRLNTEFIENLRRFTFPEIAFEVSRRLFDGAIPEVDLRDLVQRAINFPAPLVPLDAMKCVLELFHGPSLAFKDFGARFMAGLMSYFNRGESRELTILVATSGDTGGAVAMGFHRTPGIRVVILYPSGKVSPLQEKQLTTLGDNVTAVEVDGVFDDCQALVKRAFLDAGLREKLRLSSANSINIARLIPQSFYYFEAYRQLPVDDRPVVFCVPSGNFGNLTAGLMARRMGLPIEQFIAATNVNDVVPRYLNSGDFTPLPTRRTLSNAMDVGNPSNFARMRNLFDLVKGNDGAVWENMRRLISGYAFTDEQTRRAMRLIKERFDYTIDPHGAVGYLALDAHQQQYPNLKGVILETAHPAKFKDEVENTIEESINVPDRLIDLIDRPKEAVQLPVDYDAFRDWLAQSPGISSS